MSNLNLKIKAIQTYIQHKVVFRIQVDYYPLNDYKVKLPDYNILSMCSVGRKLFEVRFYNRE